MAITVRLTFDLEIPDLPDDDASAEIIAKAVAPLIGSSPLLPAPIAAGAIALVGASRLSTGLQQGSVTVEATHGQSWHRVEVV